MDKQSDQEQNTWASAGGHSWQVTPKEAIAIQKSMRDQMRIQPLEKTLGKIGKKTRN